MGTVIRDKAIKLPARDHFTAYLRASMIMNAANKSYELFFRFFARM